MASQPIPEAVVDGSAVLRHDGFDVASYQDAAHLVPELAQVSTPDREPLATAEGLTRDIYWGLQQPVPQLVPNVPLAPGYDFNAKLLGDLMQTQEWQALRQAGTVGDELTAGLGALRTAREVIKALPPGARELLNAQHAAGQEALDASEEAEGWDDLADLFTEQGDEERARDANQAAEDARARATEAQEEANDYGKDLGQIEDGIIDAARQAGRLAAGQAQTEVEDLTGLAQTFGGWDRSPASPRRLPAERVLALVKRTEQNPVLKDIARLLGRMENICARVQATRSDRPPTDVVGVETGRDVEHLLPDSLALLALPVTQPLFYAKWQEGSLHQYELAGQSPQGEGTLIILTDQSGSMMGQTPGSTVTKRAWAAAVEIALARLAAKQARDFVSVHFSHGAEDRVFPLGKTSRNDILDMAEDFRGGGTEYATCLHKALAHLKTSRFKNADVIITSDGDVYLDESLVAAWQEAKAALGFKCVGVLVGTTSGRDQLERICDAVMPIARLADDGPVLETLFNV